MRHQALRAECQHSNSFCPSPLTGDCIDWRGTRGWLHLNTKARREGPKSRRIVSPLPGMPASRRHGRGQSPARPHLPTTCSCLKVIRPKVYWGIRSYQLLTIPARSARASLLLACPSVTASNCCGDELAVDLFARTLLLCKVSCIASSQSSMLAVDRRNGPDGASCSIFYTRGKFWTSSPEDAIVYRSSCALTL